ncbi:hypothetical protein HMPREF1142_0807 [Peptostreptococcaceae bacterium AS15]|nr:hypothetical protein HMPREF1142_0807 [Peptostreptococcaceae bacterium AS15]
MYILAKISINLKQYFIKTYCTLILAIFVPNVKEFFKKFKKLAISKY